MTTSPPRGYHTIAPYALVENPRTLITFLTAVFGATEKELIADSEGHVRHAEMQVGDSVVMMGGTSPGRPIACYVFVDDVDATYERALAAGATSRGAPEDKFYGNREAGFVDPDGNLWYVATPFAEVPAEEIQARFNAAR